MKREEWVSLLNELGFRCHAEKEGITTQLELGRVILEEDLDEKLKKLGDITTYIASSEDNRLTYYVETNDHTAIWDWNENEWK